MQISSITISRAALAAESTVATDVNVDGGMRDRPPKMSSSTEVRIATKDLLNHPSELINKNTIASDNNAFTARSNLVFLQNDRLAMREEVQQAMDIEADASAAVLTNNVYCVPCRRVTRMRCSWSRRSVVAAKNAGDSAMLAQRIADFAGTAAEKEMDEEQAMQSQVPRGVIMLIGTKDVLRQPTTSVNKNVVASDNQFNVVQSKVAPSQNDHVMLNGINVKVTDVVLPAAVNVGLVTKTEDEVQH